MTFTSKARVLLRLIGALIALGIFGCGQAKRPVTLNFVLPNGTIGFFIVPIDVSASRGPITIDVPNSGRSQPIPDGPYYFGTARYKNGTPIVLSRVMGGPGATEVGEVELDWVQEPHPEAEGMLFFLGSEAEYKALFPNKKIGLKPRP